MKKHRRTGGGILGAIDKIKKPLGGILVTAAIITMLGFAGHDDLKEAQSKSHLTHKVELKSELKQELKQEEKQEVKQEWKSLGEFKITALSEKERRVVECTVMGEAGAETYAGKMLVAQCIKNACEKDDLKPSEVIVRYKYSGWNDDPTEETKKAVKAVFDNGETVTEEKILYFYSPKHCRSKWHETQKYVLTEGGHRFFAEK